MIRGTIELTEELFSGIPTGGQSETRKVKTSRFGEIEVEEEKILTMTSPFLGFPESRSFILRPHHAASPFMWLQSLDNPNLAFVVIQPVLLSSEYQPTIPKGVREELGLESGARPELLVILTIPREQAGAMTANLLAPVVINLHTRRAKQVLLDPNRYDPCWPVVRGANGKTA